MKINDTLIDGVMPCRPEWVRLNDLLTYCKRSISPSTNVDTPDTASGTRPCNGSACVFGFRKKIAVS